MRRRRFVLGLLLCLLAFSFALEAKLAWYGPGNGALGPVSSEKAQPIRPPALVSHGIPSHPPVTAWLPLLALALFGAAIAVKGNLRGLAVPLDSATKTGASFCFTPALFFRPPPAL
jgi:hypothetical protein